jgi:hypothetical protein
MTTQSQTVGFYICSYSFLTLLSFIIICFVLCIPILDIYFGFVFQDEIICQTNLIPINKWLIIKGIFNINYIIISIIFVCSDFKSCMYCLCLPIITVAQIFNFSWLIVGGIVFFRDCPCLVPVEINTYMYFSIIIGIISLFNSNYISSYKKEKHTEKKPMLDV